MISKKAGDLFAEHNIAVYSCHPGVVSSNVLRGLGFGGWSRSGSGSDDGDGDHTAGDGCARMPIKLAMDPSVGMRQTGTYWKGMRQSNCRYSQNKAKVDLVWEYCIQVDGKAAGAASTAKTASTATETKTKTTSTKQNKQ